MKLTDRLGVFRSNVHSATIDNSPAPSGRSVVVAAVVTEITSGHDGDVEVIADDGLPNR